MKNKLLWIVFALTTTVQAAIPDSGMPRPPELRPEQQQAQAAFLATEVLTRYHYKPKPLDDALSGKIFDNYLKLLDSEKLFFVQSDIDRLTAFRSKLDDAILEENLGAPFVIFNLYAQRVSERFTYARRLLRDGFDFQQQESYQFERRKAAWARSDDEMRELWHKRVKNDWLQLKLSGKDDKSIVATLDARYQHALKRNARLKSEDAFQAFMNAYTMAIEPHTNYMGVRAAEDFDIAMKLSLVGIGAVLMEKDEYTTIRELIPGGPAALSGQVKVGDRILGVAQGANGAMTDILGWRLDDSVTLIRGASDSVVLLDVLPAEAGPNDRPKQVSLIRKKITIEEQAARKSVLSVMDGKATRHVGVISLPSFYQDFDARQKGDPEFKSATRDVARLLGELKQEKVDGVLIDLRNNGGGSLSEAIELTGLFIGKGPVVQQRNARGKITVENDSTTKALWAGPLGVLINRGSASASEIFAAAIQDYGRGLVIGEPSFGKGTVQTMINLDQLVKNDKPQFGELKMTIAQFFRINGGTTQLRGVRPDILFPTVPDEENLGESSYDNALPWMQIKAAGYTPSANLKHLLPTLLVRHEERVKKDRDFQFLQEDLAELKLQRRKNQVSLNAAERQKERQIQEARQVSREVLRKEGKSADETNLTQETGSAIKPALMDDGLQAAERNLNSELAAEKSRRKAKDIFLDEAVNIIGDAIELLKTSAALTARVKPDSILIPRQKQAMQDVSPGIW